MTYTPGVHWHVTHLDGKTITWVTDGDRRAVASVIDPDSNEPARRVTNGRVVELDEPDLGLTVYGTSELDRPDFAAFRRLAPGYAHLVDGIEERRGITHHRITSDPARTYLTAAEVANLLGVDTHTIYSYKARGVMPEPDDHVGRTPRWTTATIAAWERPGRGAGGGRPRKQKDTPGRHSPARG